MLSQSPAVRVRVLYADTDAGGVVYNAAYLRFLEAGRAEAIRSTGTNYGVLVNQGLQLPVVELNIRYESPAYYDDLLAVFVTVQDLRKVRVTFEYEVRRESDNRTIARARTIHACVDVAKGRPVALPDWARNSLQQLPTTSIPEKRR
jgi:acyl-CoA thioester hydrolase